MTDIVFMGDIKEENGKTIRENNLEREHKIPIHAMVEIEHDEWFGRNGGGIMFKGRLFVSGHMRDCDGSPLYMLTNRDDVEFVYRKTGNINLDVSVKVPKMWKDWMSAEGKVCKDELAYAEGWDLLKFNQYGPFGEDSLKVIEVTDKHREGYDVLTWGDMRKATLKEGNNTWEVVEEENTRPHFSFTKREDETLEQAKSRISLYLEGLGARIKIE